MSLWFQGDQVKVLTIIQFLFQSPKARSRTNTREYRKKIAVVMSDDENQAWLEIFPKWTFSTIEMGLFWTWKIFKAVYSFTVLAKKLEDKLGDLQDRYIKLFIRLIYLTKYKLNHFHTNDNLYDFHKSLIHHMNIATGHRPIFNHSEESRNATTIIRRDLQMSTRNDRLSTFT